jgi:hypothetical protein
LQTSIPLATLPPQVRNFPLPIRGKEELQMVQRVEAVRRTELAAQYAENLLQEVQALPLLPQLFLGCC